LCDHEFIANDLREVKLAAENRWEDSLCASVSQRVFATVLVFGDGEVKH